MKTYSKDEIVRKVRVKLDEIAANESEMMLTDEDNANLDTIIKSCISEGYRLAVTLADDSFLEGVDASSSELEIDDNMVGRVKLPVNFLRCINIRLSSWVSSYADIITDGDMKYRMQSNKWVCGSSNHPVVALVYTEKGKVFELYKASSKEDTLSAFTYIPAIESDAESLSVPDMVDSAFIYFVAALTASTFRDDVANDFFKIARSNLGLE